MWEFIFNTFLNDRAPGKDDGKRSSMKGDSGIFSGKIFQNI